MRVVRTIDRSFRLCGFRGCTMFASFVMCAGGEPQCVCCAQCAAVGVRGQRDAVARRTPVVCKTQADLDRVFGVGTLFARRAGTVLIIEQEQARGRRA